MSWAKTRESGLNDLARQLRFNRCVSACAAKPLHRLTHDLEHVSHASLRGQLALIVDLAEEELARPGSRNVGLLRDFQARASRLLQTASVHFHREETRLFPAVRLAEDGLLAQASRLGLLVLDLRRDHVVIRAQIDEIRDLAAAPVAGACPLVEMLYNSLSVLADDFERHLDEEERALFPPIEARLTHTWDSPCWAVRH